MKTNHLNDRQIQQFTFERSECDFNIISHIDSCEICKIRSEAYLSLSNRIKDQSPPTLDYDLSKLVYDQIESSNKKEAVSNFFINSLLATSIGMVGIVLYVFMENFLDLFDNLESSFTFLVLGVVLIIATFLIIDLGRSFNKKIKMIDFY